MQANGLILLYITSCTSPDRRNEQKSAQTYYDLEQSEGNSIDKAEC
jgi:hypothetical protein